MVLKLKDLCLNLISKEFDAIGNFNERLLNSVDKQLIIERVLNHQENQFDRQSQTLEQCAQSLQSTTSHRRRRLFVRYFFNGFLKCLKFVTCNQFDDQFVTLLKQHHDDEKGFYFSSLLVSRCLYISDSALKCLLVDYASSTLEELTLNNLTIKLELTLGALKSPRLTKVDLSHCHLTNKDLWTLCKNNPSIRVLILEQCPQLTHEGVRSSLHMLKQIEVLNLTGITCNGASSFFIDTSCPQPLPQISINFKGLKKLAFCASYELASSVWLRKLFDKWENLNELVVYCSSPMSNETKTNNATTNGPDTTRDHYTMLHLPSRLISLTLYRPEVQNSQTLIDSLKRLSHLSELSLYGVNCLNDSTINALLEAIGPQLRLLNLSGYLALVSMNSISEQSVKAIAKHCRNLTSLTLEQFSSTASFESLKSLFENAQTAVKFKHVNLSTCRTVSYELLTQLALNCKNLEKLYLNGLSECVDDTLMILLSKTAHGLRELEIKACQRVTDKAIESLAVNCPRLRVLVLAGICNLTDKSVFALANNLQLTLNELYISGCSRISPVSLRYLTDCCVNRLHIEHKLPVFNSNHLMARNLDTGDFERFVF